MIGKKSFELEPDNLIQVSEPDENGQYTICKEVTEHNVFIIIENELKDIIHSEILHDIRLFDGHGDVIAYCNNPKEDNKLVFITIKLKV